MRGMFSMDSPLMQFLTKVADLIILNILFLVFSIPIFTMGASMSAMYYVTLKLVKDEECYVTKQFVASFKENFKQATLIWVVMLIIAIGLVYDAYVSVTGGSPEVFKIVLIVLSVIWGIMFIHVFPLIAKFDNTTLNIIRNALVIGLTHAVKTAFMILFTAVPFVVIWKKIELFPVVAMLGFSTIAFINSVWIRKIYDGMIETYMKPSVDESDTNSSESDTDYIDNAGGYGISDAINKRINSDGENK